MDDPLQALAADLTLARDRAQFPGYTVSGVRAVGLTDGGRYYLCALDDGRVRFLDATFDVVDDDDVCHRIAGAALTVEHVEELLDGGEAALVGSLADRAADLVDDPVTRTSLRALGETSAQLAAWRSDPLRALATLADLDDAAALHAAAHADYRRFVAATEPLVAMQASLPAPLVGALADLENACGRAGIAGSLAEAVGQAMEAIMSGARELVELRVD